MKQRICKKTFIIIILVYFFALYLSHDRKSHPKLEKNLKKKLLLEQNEFVVDHPIGVKYRILPNKTQICPNNKIFYISYVYIDVKNFERRLQTRKSWSDKTLFPFQRNIFVLGMSLRESLNQMIEYENERHGDILMGNVSEIFRLMYSKSVLALGWLTNNCPQTRFFIKLKYDTELNPPKLASHLLNVTHENYLLCDFNSKPKVNRNKKSKFNVLYSEYKFYHYKSRYICSEHGYVLSESLARQVFKQSFKTPIFWIDDVYVSNIIDKIGINAEKLKTIKISYDKFDLLNQNQTFFYNHQTQLTQDFDYAWNLIKNKSNYSKFVLNF